MPQRGKPISAIMLAWLGKKLHVPGKKICCRTFFFVILNLMQSPPAQDGLAGKPLFKNTRNIKMT